MISIGTHINKPASIVAIVLTIWDRWGDIIDIIDMPADAGDDEVRRMRAHALNLPRAHRVTRNDVSEQHHRDSARLMQ